MNRTDLLDTTPEAHRAQVELLREKGPEWRIRKTLELIDTSRRLFPEQTRKAILACRKKP